MRYVIAAGVLALGLSACSPPTAEDSAPNAIANGCGASAVMPWRPLSGAEFVLEASANGPDCEHAVATIVIRDAQGDVLWAEAHVTQYVMTLASARDRSAMARALHEWIDPAGNTTMQTSSALPEWPENATGPQNGEFPFYPEEGFDREAYNTLRTNNLPLYCYVQGMESLACLALADGEMDKVGVQSFPG